MISQYTQPSLAKTSTPLCAALDVMFVRHGVCPQICATKHKGEHLMATQSHVSA